jgi:hypothetical protein
MMMIFKIVKNKELIRQELDRMTINAEVQHAEPKI